MTISARGAVLAALALAATPVTAAQAAVVFQFAGATLSSAPGGGTLEGALTGTFTTNDALDTILSFDITASAAGAFSGYEYAPATAAVTASVLPSQYFQLDSPGSVNELRIYFASPLTSAGASINPVFSYEYEASGGNRYPGGAVVAAAPVPEPASWAMMVCGFALTGFALRRRSAGEQPA